MPLVRPFIYDPQTARLLSRPQLRIALMFAHFALAPRQFPRDSPPLREPEHDLAPRPGSAGSFQTEDERWHFGHGSRRDAVG